MNNYQDAVIGKRIRLIETMKNPNSTWIPEENIPAGTEGTITWVEIHGDKRFDQITVQWDCGSTLGLFPYHDKYTVL